jgi:predicted ATP-grasp superfamily ATP-dependent carboligase
VVKLTKIQSYEKTIEQSEKPIAFILGKYITGGLGVVRCLGREGVPVIWLDTNVKQIGFRSKFCDGVICPHPRYNPKEYIDLLLNIGKKLNQKGVLFPIRDIEVYLILENKSKLEKYYNIPIADLKITKKFLNKYHFYKTIEKLKIPHPKTYFSNDDTEVGKISKKIKYPCILKPCHSAAFVLDFNTKLFTANSQKELIQLYKKALSKNHEVIIQEIIPGDARNMHGLNAYYNKTSKPIGVFTYRRIREWPLKMGNGCFIESVKIPEINKIVTPLIKSIKFHGIVDAEIRRDPRDNEFKLIEINSRCWMQNSLPAKCGLNIPYIAYLDAIGKKIKTPKNIKTDIKWLFMWEDFHSSIRSILKGDLSISEWIRSYKGEKEYSILAFDDIMPFFYSLTPFYTM